MVFDELRQAADLSANVNRSGWVWYLRAVEYGADALVGLVFLGDMHEGKGPGIERLHVFWGAEPLLAEMEHHLPVPPDGVHYDGRYEIGHSHVREKV